MSCVLLKITLSLPYNQVIQSVPLCTPPTCSPILIARPTYYFPWRGVTTFKLNKQPIKFSMPYKGQHSGDGKA